jgi:hypothetical protein
MIWICGRRFCGQSNDGNGLDLYLMWYFMRYYFNIKGYLHIISSTYDIHSKDTASATTH